MTILFEERFSDSPYIETVTQGRTASAGSTVRPSEYHWHLIFTKLNGIIHPIITGPLTSSGIVSYGEGAEMLWIRFKLGVFMPHLPVKDFLDTSAELPTAAGQSFWLKSAAWQFPDFENVETFINRLAREEILMRDPLVMAALQDQPLEMSARTVRHRFLQATGLSQNHIRQAERARCATMMLEQGVPILDVVYELGYFDQPHLTKSLKRFVGKTPGQQVVRQCQEE